MIKDLQKLFNIVSVTTTVGFSPSDTKNDDITHIASMSGSSTYRWMEFTIYPALLRQYRREGRRAIVDGLAHEVVHYLIMNTANAALVGAGDDDRARELTVDMIEAEVSNLTEVFLKLLSRQPV